MTTFTPASFFKACEEFAALSDALPPAVLGGIGQFSRTALAQGSAGSGGVKASLSQFAYKKPRVSAGQASARVVGRGFAILDEFGSYKKPNGYLIPTHRVKRKKRRGNTIGPVSARWHPAQKPHPYVAGAETKIAVVLDAAFDKGVDAVIAKAFR